MAADLVTCQLVKWKLSINITYALDIVADNYTA